MSIKLTVKNLSHTYQQDGKKLQALSGIDITVNKGQFVSIIGPNGSGKSTFLKIIAGITKQTTGTVQTEGKTSYMPQSDSLLPWRSVEDNLLLSADIQGSPRLEAQKRARIFLKEFDLISFSKFYPSALSGGLKQKAALLRTAINDSSFLLLDEPFAALDALTRLESQKWLLRLYKRLNSTILLVTHDIDEALTLSDTIYVLSKRPGKILKKISVKGKNKAKVEKELFSLLMN